MTSGIKHAQYRTVLPVRAHKSTHQRRNLAGLPEYLRGSPPEAVLDELEVIVDLSAASCIGKGTFGDVISAHLRNGGQQVAVKVLPYRPHSEDADRIRREVNALNDLIGHPNLIQLIGLLKCSSPILAVSKEPPFICIVMDYIADSLPLSQHIYYINDLQECSKGSADQQRWVDSFAFHVIGSVASALYFMHQRGYVHRDVWGENILVSKTGKVVLCDLGSAERHDIPDNRRAELNIPYMSPSAWQSLKQVPGDDCWALGLVLSEVVTGWLMNQRLGGNTSRPIHCNTWAVQQILSETLTRSAVLGRLCERMLQEYLTLDMKEIADTLQSDSSQCPVLPDMNWDASSISQLSSTHAPSCASDQLSHTTETSIWSKYPELSTASHRTVEFSSPRITVGHVATTASSMASKNSILVPNIGDVSTPQVAVAHGFSPGQRVKYIARSNGVWYPGVLVGRLAGNVGWLVRLDCGTTKEVDDRDARRLQKE